MDFEDSYTEEQEQFRKEVHAWLEKSIPEKMKAPIERRTLLSDEQYRFWREKHKELAAKGWLFSTYPKQYGGGGLTADHETILEEEFHRFRVMHSFTSIQVFPALLVWATEEQKQKFLVPILKSEKIAWMKFTEPHSGSDSASYESKAVRDGDDWLLSGSNVFISGIPDSGPDWLFGPMLTDPEAPRHRNLGYFMIPVPTPGLEIRRMKLLTGDEQHFIYLDNVRVPGNHLIGNDHQGWQVANSTLEQEHGGRGRAFPKDDVVDNLLGYMRDMKHEGKAPGGDPVLQQTVVESHVEGHIGILLQRRTYGMYMSRTEMSWEAPVGALYRRMYGLRNAGRVRDVMGMYSMLGTKEPLAPHGGMQEVEQRHSLQHQHGAGSLNIAKVTLARRIGISRTRERAAPTPMTAVGQG